MTAQRPPHGRWTGQRSSPQSALNTAWLFALVAGSGLPWPLPPWRTEPESPQLPSVSAHGGAWGTGWPFPRPGPRGGDAPRSARGRVIWPRKFMPRWGRFPWFANGREESRCAPWCRSGGARPRSPTLGHAPGRVSQPPGALSPPQGLLLCLVLFFTRSGNTHFVHS